MCRHAVLQCIILTDKSYSMISPLYMAEISPPEVRGSLMALEQFSIVLGVVFGFWAGFFTRGSAKVFPTISVIQT